MTADDGEWWRIRILTAPILVRDQENPYAEDIITDSSAAQDARLPVLAKVASLTESLRLGGSCELIHRLWCQVSLATNRVNIDVALSRNEVLVVNFFLPFFYVFKYVVLLVFCFSGSYWTGCTLSLFSRMFGWVKASGSINLELRSVK